MLDHIRGPRIDMPIFIAYFQEVKVVAGVGFEPTTFRL